MQNLEILKSKVKKLNTQNFVPCCFEDMKNGDIVLSWTITNSQKYLLRKGFEDYNKTKYGILIQKDNNFPQNSIMLEYDSYTGEFIATNLFSDPGSSGEYSLQKYIDVI